MIEPKRFRKKPVEIEACRVPIPPEPPMDIEEDGIVGYLNESLELAEWCRGSSHMMLQDNEEANGVFGPHILVPTLDATAVAHPGDWIIKGVKGEFYPCKDDILRETYEPVED